LEDDEVSALSDIVAPVSDSTSTRFYAVALDDDFEFFIVTHRIKFRLGHCRRRIDMVHPQGPVVGNLLS